MERLPENKEKAQALITWPLTELYQALAPAAQGISPTFETKPAKCISTLFSDMRFSRGAPLKTYLYLRFREPGHEKDALGLFFDMGCQDYGYGLRIYHQTSAGMEKIRAGVQKNRAVKKMLLGMEADLCGIASIDRFSDAPEGYHPLDVLPQCQSVIVFAKRFLAGTVACKTTVPYTIIRNIVSDQLDKIAVRFCYEMEARGVIAIPTGTNGPTEFDVRTNRSRNIVSAKHAAQAAGLGVIGKNTLLITPEYGNMVWLSVILTELSLEPDPLLTSSLCPPKCTLCVDACPVHATGEPELKQTVCWNYAFGGENGGEFKIKCNKCRTVCPYCFGTENRGMRRG